MKGTIIGKTNNQTIVSFTNKREIPFPSSQIVGNTGDTVFFNVIEQTTGKIQIRQTNLHFFDFEKFGQQRQSSVLHLFGAKQSNHRGEKVDVFKEKIKETQVLNKLKRDFQYKKNVMGSNIVNQLVACGINLDKIDLSFFRKAATTLESAQTPDIPEAMATAIAHRYMDERPITDKPNPNTFAIAKALVQKGLPITSQNVSVVDHTLTQWDEVKKLPPEKFMPLLAQEKPLTLENMVMYKRILHPLPNVFSPKDMAEIQPQVEKTLVENELPVNTETRQAAEHMIFQNVAITKDNYEKYQWLTNLKNAFSEEELIIASIHCIQKDEKPLSMDLFNVNHFNTIYKNNQNIQQQIGTIDLPCIQSCLHHSNLNLQGLLMHRNTSPPSEITREAIQVQKQLLEIQMKLTTEASYQLANKNIAIDTMPLQKVLDTLNQLSDNYSYLKWFQDNPTPQQIQLANQVQDCVHKFMTTRTDWSFLKKEDPITLQVLNPTMSIEATSAYDAAQTTVRPCFGDTFQSIEGQVPDFLAAIGMEATEENIQAFAILSSQQMDITKTNMVKVRLIQEKMDFMKQQLHPAVIAKMIANGKNPFSMAVDEILRDIEDFRKQYGVTTEEHILNALSKVKEDTTLPEAVYDKMLHFYKMMYTIEKNNAFAIGETIKNERPLTITQLFETAQYQHKTKHKGSYIDTTVSSTTGLLENSLFSQHSISTAESEWIALNQMYFEKIATQLTPPLLQHLLQHQVGAPSTPLAELKNTVTHINPPSYSDDIEGTSSKSDILDDIFSITDSPLSLLQWMDKNGIPSTPVNTRLVQKMLKNEHLLSDLLNENDGVSLVNGLDLTDLWHNLDKIEQALDQFAPENQKNLHQLIQLQKSLNTNHPNVFSVPILQGNGFTNLNLWVVDDGFIEKKEKNILLSLNMPHLGVVQCWIKQNQQETQIHVTSENKRVSAFLEQQSKDIPLSPHISMSFAERTDIKVPFLKTKERFV